MAKKQTSLTVETLKHEDVTRKNIPTAEFQSVMSKDEESPVRLAYQRRNRDLEPQMIWRGKVQCILPRPALRPPTSSEWSTTSRDVKDGNTDHITREPEQVKAFQGALYPACGYRQSLHNGNSFCPIHKICKFGRATRTPFLLVNSPEIGCLRTQPVHSVYNTFGCGVAMAEFACLNS